MENAWGMDDKNSLVPIYNKQGDTETKRWYKLWWTKAYELHSKTQERVIKQVLIKEISVRELEKIWFYDSEVDHEAIYLSRILMDKYKEKKRDLHIIFNGLGKLH